VSVVIGIAINGRSPSLNLAREITFTLLYLNSCLTPLVYGLRSKELKAACKELVKGLGRMPPVAMEATEGDRVTPSA